MREVTIRRFHQSMWEELKDLPLVITRRGKPSFLVDVIPGGMEPREVSHKVPGENPKNFLLKKCVVKVCDRSGKANVKIEGDERFVCGEHLVGVRNQIDLETMD